MSDFPSVSIVIPTYNEEKNIGRCLSAIFNQDYPKNLLEVIIVDNYSNDRTLEIVKNFNVKIYFNKIRDAEVSKMIGLHKATKELFLYLDADIEIVGENWLKKLVKPLTENFTIVGAFPRFIPKPTDVPLGRFLRYHPLELDPVFQFFCTKIEDTIVEEKNEYKICKFYPPKVPPVGICIYRREILLKTIGNMEKFMDIDIPVILSKKGYNKFAYVLLCGIYHTNIRNLKDLIHRRFRNIEKIYLPNITMREYKYFEIGNRKDILKIIVWVIYANLIVPKIFEGIRKTIKYRDIACMYEPLVAMVLTNAIIFSFLKNKQGRQLILKMLKGVKR